MIAYSFFFHMVHWSFILGQGWRLGNHFCKACQNCLHPSFVIVHKAVRTLLLLCYESRPQCYHAARTTPTWTNQCFANIQHLNIHQKQNSAKSLFTDPQKWLLWLFWKVTILHLMCAHSCMTRRINIIFTKKLVNKCRNTPPKLFCSKPFL